jgi:hypothetical protein
MATIGLDTTLQISGFRKLKLTNCAPIPDLPGIGFVLCASRVNPTCGRETAPGFSCPDLGD